jgi:hypothetical protein
MKYFICLLLLITSCKTDPTITDIDKASPGIDSHIQVVKAETSTVITAADKTIDEADAIKKTAEGISKTVPKESKDISSRADAVKNLQDSIKGSAQKMEISSQNLTVANERVIALEAQNSSLKKEVAKEKAAKKAALFGKLVYLIMCSVILGAICIVVAIRGETKAFWGAAVAGAVIVISLGISFYAKQLAIAGAVALVVGLGLVIWNAYSEFIHRKAAKELVYTVEASKESMSVATKKEIFGEGAKAGQAHALQSSSTKELVNKLRVKAKKHWEPTIAR